MKTAAVSRWTAVGLLGVLLCAAAVPAAAQNPPPATASAPPDVANEYRITAYPSYRINDAWSGFGYVGWVYKPDADYSSYYLGKGVFYNPYSWLQVWGGLIGVYTDNTGKSDLLELRPFVGPKFMGKTARKWRYYNWTRYELRLTETLDTDEWKTVHRLRNQTRIEVPLASFERAWTPKSWYLLADAEPIYRSDTDQLDPLRLRAGIGYIASPRVLVEFQYYAQYTHPGGGGLAYTDNIFRLNIKLSTRAGIFRLLDGGIDD
jgi:hypothetical protein